MAVHFTPIPTTSAVAVMAATINSRLQELDDAIVSTATDITSVEADLADLIAGSTSFTQLSVGAPGTALIIDGSDSITISKSNHLVDTSGASNDDLVTINGGADGDVLFLRPVSSARVITVKQTGNIHSLNGADILMNDPTQLIMFLRDGTNSKWTALSYTFPAFREVSDTSSVGLREIVVPDHLFTANGTDGESRRMMVSPSLTAANFWGVRAAAAAIQPLGIAAVTNAATTVLTASNQTEFAAINVASGAVSGNAGGFGSTTFNLTRREYDPIFEMVIKIPAAGDIANVRMWHGLFQAAPTNVDTLTAGRASVFFNYSTALGHTTWYVGCNDGTNQSALVNTGVFLVGGTVYRLRLRVDSAAGVAYFSISTGTTPSSYTTEVSVNTNLPPIATELGFYQVHFTTAAAAKNWLFSRSEHYSL